MSIAFAVRDGKKFWVATNSTLATSGINIPNEYKATLPIFKVNDVLICYHGDQNSDDDILVNLDFSAIKAPLTENQIFRQFFLPMTLLTQKDSLVSKEDDGSISNYPSGFLFLSSSGSYSFIEDAVRRIQKYEFLGTATEAAMGAFDWFCGQRSPADLAVEVVKGAIRFSADTSYPILLANTEDPEMSVIEEDGQVKKIQIPVWEKGARK
jgi:hypothetical protein